MLRGDEKKGEDAERKEGRRWIERCEGSFSFQESILKYEVRPRYATGVKSFDTRREKGGEEGRGGRDEKGHDWTTTK